MPDPMEDLRQSLERFAEVFVATVTRQLKAELDALTLRYAGPPILDASWPESTRESLGGKLAMACPNTADHPRHVWSFPKSAQSRQCPGVNGFPVERCQKSDPHAAHDWEMDDAAGYGTLGRHCPGLASRQCPDNLAHHVHAWRSQPWVFSCPGIETDRDVQYCTSRPYDHAAHEYDQDAGDGKHLTVFCKGTRPEAAFREPCLILTPHEPHDWQADPSRSAGNLARRCGGVRVEVKRCPQWSILNQHPAHNWGDSDCTKACPGQGPMVPAGPDRQA